MRPDLPFAAYKTGTIASLEFPPTFTQEGGRKDIRLAIDLAHEFGRPDVPSLDNTVRRTILAAMDAHPMAPLLTLARAEYLPKSRSLALVSGGLGHGRDVAALILEVARDAGREMKPEVKP